MAAKKLRVNAKSFIADLRFGMDSQRLMEKHGLDAKALDKLLEILVKKGLLDPSEAMLDTPTIPPDEEVGSYSGSLPEMRSDTEVQTESHPIPAVNLTECPECGARVPEKALTCPECGHVLPGQERWEEVEPKKRLVDRIPPVVLGIILAIPVAVVLFFFFKDFMLPATESTIQKRARAIRRYTPDGKSPMQAAKDMAGIANRQVLIVRVEKLMAQGVFSNVDPDYYTFTTGPRWIEFERPEQLEYISQVQSAMRRAGMRVEFEVVDPSGLNVATVIGQSVRFAGEPEPDELSPVEQGFEDKSPPPRTVGDDFRDTVGKQLQRSIPGLPIR